MLLPPGEDQNGNGLLPPADASASASASASSTADGFVDIIHADYIAIDEAAKDGLTDEVVDAAKKEITALANADAMDVLDEYDPDFVAEREEDDGTQAEKFAHLLEEPEDEDGCGCCGMSMGCGCPCPETDI